MTVAPDVTIEFTCNGLVSVIQPTWFLNGTFVESDGNCYRSRLRRLGELNATAILTINGNNDDVLTSISTAGFSGIHNSCICTTLH